MTGPVESPGPDGSPLLSVKDLCVSFRAGRSRKNVLHDVDLHINAGETLAVIGESGSGKSVTSLAIMRLLDARMSRVSGNVRFDGVDLLALPERQMMTMRGRDIGMIFQEPMTS